jgi:GDP-4-dehydro-6-deoxy-D-mannose reductase
MKKILITGVNGFVGQHLLTLLDGYFVIGLTHLGDLIDTENRKFHEGNILDLGCLEDLVTKYHPEVIFHLAAIAPTNYKDSEQVFKINLMGTNNLYQAVLNVREQDSNFNPKIVFVSSAEVYGKTNNPDHINEESALNPLNFYGSSKLAADRLTYQLSQSNNLNTIILRPFNHTGPGQLKGFFVPDMASQIVNIEKDNGKNEIMVGNLESVRDLSDVRDIVQAYKLVIDQDVEPGEVYNICSGNGVVMKDVLEKLLSFASKKIEIKQDESRMRASDNPIAVGNNQKFKNKFGWEPKYSLDQTLEDTLKYWKEKEATDK